MDFKALEDDAIARIQSGLGANQDTRIVAWPDSPGSFGQPTGSGLVMVRFGGLSLSSPSGIDRFYTKQTGSIELQIRTFSKSLRSHSGAYSLFALVHKALSGWFPNLATPLSAKMPGFHLISYDLLAKNEQVWDWGAVFKLDVILEHTNQ